MGLTQYAPKIILEILLNRSQQTLLGVVQVLMAFNEPKNQA